MIIPIASLLLVSPASAQQAPSTAATRGELKSEAVSFENGDVKLAATLVWTPSDTPQPAAVIVHGSGASDRSNPWTLAWAEALARSGLVVLHPDKRGSGASGGDWLAASFETLAEDAAAGMNLLRGRPEVDANRVVVIGFSQGSYVLPLVARRPGCAGVVSVSGGVRALLDQTVDELVLEAGREGRPLDGEDEAAVRGVYRQLLLAARSEIDWEVLQRDAEAARARGANVAHALRTLPSGASHPAMGWIRLVGEFDPLPHWRSVAQPALFVYGGRDEQVRVRESVERLWSLPPGSRDIVVFGGNGHALFRDDAVALVARWIADGGRR